MCYRELLQPVYVCQCVNYLDLNRSLRSYRQSLNLCLCLNVLQHKLEGGLLALGQFQHALDELLAWMSHTDELLGEQRKAGGDPKAIEIELAKHHVSPAPGAPQACSPPEGDDDTPLMTSETPDIDQSESSRDIFFFNCTRRKTRSTLPFGPDSAFEKMS